MLSDCLEKGCLGKGDAEALRALLAALEEELKRFDLLRRAALSLAGDACGLAAEVESMDEAGVFGDCDADGDAESGERRSALLALCDSIALEAGKVDTYAERGDA